MLPCVAVRNGGSGSGYGRSPLLLAAAAVLAPWAAAQPLHWPTPGDGFEEGEPYENWVQATASGNPESALFGCVRNNGNRFHEGLDIAPVLPRRRGEATDPVFAVMDGRVAYINRAAGNSGYGRYIVVVHDGVRPAVHTLYAHLASIAEGIEEGARVEGGQTLGIMGRSAGGYTIPRHRAHLHLEVGLRLTDGFQAWYDRQEFGSANHHGVWSGFNMVGFDPLDFFTRMRTGEVSSVDAYLASIPVGAVVRVTTDRIPDFVRRYPRLLWSPVPEEGVGGWEVMLSGWGLPLRFIPLSMDDPGLASTEGVIEIIAVDPGQLDHYRCRHIISMGAGGAAALGRGGSRVLQLLFGFN
ncbi:MAG: M23 family metallopeptidase [Opitutales bacterium]|nr:M23 family metallopeptidase [Opitutales bacterium]